jgi:hypothetical protein
MSHVYLNIDNLQLVAVLSNLVLLIPFVTAIKKRRIIGAFILFVECWVSLTYHVCTYSNNCLLPYTSLKAMDFFFAQLFIVYLSVYLVIFTDRWTWLEWVLILTGAFIIALMQFLFPSELYVQAGIVVVCLSCVLIYMFVYYHTTGNGKLPKYHWKYLGLGFSCIAISIMMFSIQNVFPSLYWAAHGVWHAIAAMGFHYILNVKDSEANDKMINLAQKIKYTKKRF